MSRVPAAVVVGLAGFAVYVVVVASLADGLMGAAWPWQAAYFAITGSAWVLPARWLMLRAARLR